MNMELKAEIEKKLIPYLQDAEPILIASANAYAKGLKDGSAMVQTQDIYNKAEEMILDRIRKALANEATGHKASGEGVKH